jgi:hypothetical protein
MARLANLDGNTAPLGADNPLVRTLHRQAGVHGEFASHGVDPVFSIDSPLPLISPKPNGAHSRPVAFQASLNKTNLTEAKLNQ